MSLFREAFTIYVKGYAKSKALLNDLKLHSRQFRLFLKETQTETLNLDDLLDLPLIYLNETLNIFKEIRHFTCESKRNPSEAPHIDSVILELRSIIELLEMDEHIFFYENNVSSSTLSMRSFVFANKNNTCSNNFELTNLLFQSRTFSNSSLTSSNHSDISTEES